MNNVTLVGRLVSDPELRYTKDNKEYVRTTLAVNRMISKEDKENGKQSADFISCVFWNETAKVLANFTKKGSLIAVSGRIMTGSYEDSAGIRRYTTDVRVNRLTFLGNKSSDTRPEPEYDGFGDISGNEINQFNDYNENLNISEDELPF